MTQRIIKFRAWDKQGKEMFRVFSLSFIEGKGMIASGKGGSASIDEDTILMQFTGLTDKNGQEIFEGDLFHCIYKSDGHTDIYEVVYHAGWTGFVLKRHGKCSQAGVHQKVSDVSRYEVIGNIYENPELLKSRE